jgi:hypothetical protein
MTGKEGEAIKRDGEDWGGGGGGGGLEGQGRKEQIPAGLGEGSKHIDNHKSCTLMKVGLE